MVAYGGPKHNINFNLLLLLKLTICFSLCQIYSLPTPEEDIEDLGLFIEEGRGQT